MIPRSMQRVVGHRLGIKRCYSAATHGFNRVIFFPGQGAQQIGMISDFVSNFASARRVLEQADEHLKYPISKLIASGPPEDLFRTEHAQPAIFACSAAIVSVLKDDFGVDIGKTFNWTLGHSLGEFAALWAAGVLGYEDALTICKVRGEAMRDAVVQFGGDLPSGMSALIVEPGLTTQLVKEIEAWAEKELAHSTTEVCVVANVNSSTQIVIAGTVPTLKRCVGHLRKFSGHDPRAIPLRVSCPFHTKILQPASDVLFTHLANIPFHIPPPTHMGIISNVTGRPFDATANADAWRSLLRRQTVEPVQWLSSIQYLVDNSNNSSQVWLGIGPGNVTRNLVDKELRSSQQQQQQHTVLGLTTTADIDTVLQALTIPTSDC